MRASDIGCWSTCGALRLRRRERRLAVRDPVRVAREHVEDLRLGQAGDARGAQRDQERLRLHARTGSRRRRRSAPAARGGRSSSRSIGLQTEVSKKTPALPAKWPARPERSAIPACAMISVASGYVVVRGVRGGRDRRQPAPAVDEDRDAPLRRDREDRREPLVVQLELLRARMQLDSACAEVEAALGLLDRAVGQVEPDERDQPALRLARRTRACGRWRRGRPGWRSGSSRQKTFAREIAVAVEDRRSAPRAARHAVDVVAEMRVRVEDVGARRQLAAQLRLEGGEQLLGALEARSRN